MARPTKAQQEKKRIAGLLAEGKGPDGQLLVRAKKVPFEEYDVFLKNGATRLPKAIKDLISLPFECIKIAETEIARQEGESKNGKRI